MGFPSKHCFLATKNTPIQLGKRGAVRRRINLGRPQRPAQKSLFLGKCGYREKIDHWGKPPFRLR
jgi:hypothetical protein